MADVMGTVERHSLNRRASTNQSLQFRGVFKRVVDCLCSFVLLKGWDQLFGLLWKIRYAELWRKV